MSPMLARLTLALLLIAAPASAAPPEVRGVSLAHLHHGGGVDGYGSDACRAQLDAIAALGANRVALTTFAFMEAVDRPAIRATFGSEDRGGALARTVADARARGLRVLLKPHVWSRDFARGKWPGDVRMASEAEWDAWFAAYTVFVLRHARIAQEAGAEALSIGCELQSATEPHLTPRWRKLIAEVRAVYKGHVTYSAAWEEWQQIGFWGDLDSIGTNAYWKLTDVPADGSATDDAALRAGWARVYERLEPFARRQGRPVCFTELGYSPSRLAPSEPWAYHVVNPDPELQARLYRVALEEAAKRDWVAGAFVWKWYTSADWQRHEPDEPFAIQNRPLVIEAIRAAWRE